MFQKNATQIEKLNITYDNKPIKNLYTSTIKIKNNSNSIIEPNDFAPSVPLSLVTNGEFLTSSDTGVILFSKNTDNNVYPLCELNDSDICQRLLIHFDYISKKEVISCTVFHTGSLDVNGKLKDGKMKNSELTKSSFLPFFQGILVSITATLIVSSLPKIISYLSKLF